MRRRWVRSISWISDYIPVFCSRSAGEAELLDPGIIRAIYKPRTALHTREISAMRLLVAGSYGKMGAAVLGGPGLSAERRRACLASCAGMRVSDPSDGDPGGDDRYGCG